MRRLLLSTVTLCLVGTSCETPCTSELRGYSLAGAKASIRVGDTFTPSVRALTCGGRKQEDMSAFFTWTSDAPTIASVDANGRVVGRAPGQTTIRAQAEDYSTSIPLSVTPR